jgi:hypothetical protein
MTTTVSRGILCHPKGCKKVQLGRSLLVLTVLMALPAGFAFGEGHTFRQCDIFNGQVKTCGGWFQGETVLEHDGKLRECKVFNGRVKTCGAPHNGKAVVFDDDAYRECRITNGRVMSCGGRYTGRAVL